MREPFRDHRERWRRRARVLKMFLSTPTECWLLARAVGWTLAMPVLKRVFSMRVLTRLAWAGSGLS